MTQLKATFDGNIAADPEIKDVNGRSVMEFPVLINHARKNKDTGKYAPTGDVTRVRVSLWRDFDDPDLQKGALVKITATLVNKEWTKSDGTKAYNLQTEYVEEVEIIFPAKNRAPRADAGFIPAPDSALAAGGF